MHASKLRNVKEQLRDVRTSKTVVAQQKAATLRNEQQCPPRSVTLFSRQ